MGQGEGGASVVELSPPITLHFINPTSSQSSLNPKPYISKDYFLTKIQSSLSVEAH